MGREYVTAVNNRSSRATYRIRLARLDEIDAYTASAWADVEQRALEANAYLSPHFIIPALRRLDPELSPLIVLIERTHGSSYELSGVGVFVLRPPNLRFPLPHLSAYRSPHSYLTGLLIDREYAEPAIQAFLDFIEKGGSGWHGVEFTWRSGEGWASPSLETVASERRVIWYEHSRSQRAVLRPAKCGEDAIARQLSGSRLKELRRCKRRLAEQGDVSWKLLSGENVSPLVVDRFLELEHSGWRGKAGTSLISNSAHEVFFREMIDGFRSTEGVFFTELSAGDLVVASTCNLVSGGAGFAFKIGWHPGYAKASPGVLNELELIRHAPQLCGELAFLDSGADDGSFIDKLWEDRRDLVTGVFAASPAGRLAASSMQQLRRAKRWVGVSLRRAY